MGESVKTAAKGLKFPQLQLQLFVIIASFTAVLGKLMTIEAVAIVFWRTAISAMMLGFLFMCCKRYRRRIEPLDRVKILLNGVLLGVHWITFFWAVDLANVSVCLTGMALVSFFTALSEAALGRRKPCLKEVMLGLGVVPGLLLIVGTIDPEHMNGLICAIISAFFASLFPVVNKKFVARGLPLFGLTFWQLVSASFVCAISAYLFFGTQLHISLPNQWDWLNLFILASVCTVFAFSYYIHLLKYFSAFSMNLVANFEPVYGIILAALFFKEYEQLSIWFFVGAVVIVLANMSNVLLGKRK